MIEFANLNQVEALFDEMEPGNQEGGGFTPSLHQDQIRLDDSSIELEMEEEVRDYEDAHLARIIHNSHRWGGPRLDKADPISLAGLESPD